MTADGMSRAWPSEWLRGTLQLLVLRVLRDGPAHGYAIATALTDQGLGVIKGGTLYPLLTRLEEAALVEAEWVAGQGGPGRKVFALTQAGRDKLAADTETWQHFTTTVGAILA